MMVTICNKATGHFMLRADLSPGTKADRLAKEGHFVVESEQPSKEHRWDGKEWVLDPVLQAEKSARDKTRAIAATDVGMPRIVEDLIDLLVSKGLMSLNELPEKAKQKFQARKALRNS